ncbi:methyltransferase [Actinomadura sp. KC216]|uniref:methyltransferase n=1 Tax=Actinomadura sp. KC216 TaxID=2530370 RepID=UPI001A9EBEF8|nr:methyltransferase [Actinomadura sp. KC216]
MRICTGLWAARTMAVAHALSVFELARPRSGVSVAELSEKAKVPERPAELLLTACAALGLLRVTDPGRYENTPVAEEYLVEGKPFYFGGVVQLFDRHSAPGWMRLEEALRNNAPTTWDPSTQTSLFDNLNPEFREPFWAGMNSLSIWTARQVAGHVDFVDSHRLLDVGGGGGSFDIMLCRKYPHLRATLFDLPQACAFARAKISEAGLGHRVDVVEGDFFTDELPADHDTILLSMILHDWAEDQCRTILEQCWRALSTGGRIIISELLVDDTKDGPADAALMSIHMLVETFGRNYTAAEYTRWLYDVGFKEIRTIRFEAISANGVVIGTKS